MNDNNFPFDNSDDNIFSSNNDESDNEKDFQDAFLHNNHDSLSINEYEYNEVYIDFNKIGDFNKLDKDIKNAIADCISQQGKKEINEASHELQRLLSTKHILNLTTDEKEQEQQVGLAEQYIDFAFAFRKFGSTNEQKLKTNHIAAVIQAIYRQYNISTGKSTTKSQAQRKTKQQITSLLVDKLVNKPYHAIINQAMSKHALSACCPQLVKTWKDNINNNRTAINTANYNIPCNERSDEDLINKIINDLKPQQNNNLSVPQNNNLLQQQPQKQKQPIKKSITFIIDNANNIQSQNNNPQPQQQAQQPQNNNILQNNNNANNGNIPHNVEVAIQQYIDYNQPMNDDNAWWFATLASRVKEAITTEHGEPINVDTALMYFDYCFANCQPADKHNGKLPVLLREIYDLLPPVDNVGYANPNTARNVFMNAFASRPYYYQLKLSDTRRPFNSWAAFARIWMRTPPANHNIQLDENDNNQNNNILQNNNQNNNLNILQNNNLPQQQPQQNNNINNEDENIINTSTLQKKRGRKRRGG